ncbi:hypothetical protein J4206_04940 [Candidatus Woesearchaeota archaeon]|nr:hypothetical protein [Candidatus Woesearchaeota archaeon]
MANPNEGKEYKVINIGRRGDPVIKLPGGKICIVSGAPTSVEIGDTIYITGHSSGGGNTDFARYASPPSALEQEAANVRLTSSGTPKAKVTAKSASIDSVVKDAAQSSAPEYMLKIGPTERADSCATAYCPADLLQMNAYSALIELIKRHGDPTIYRESTDRRIAAITFAIYQKAVDTNAVAELQLTIGNEPITDKTTKKLIDYFKPTIGKRYAAAAVVKKGEETGELVGAGVAAESCAVTTPSAPVRYTAASTVGRKGRPG